jgi:hypothetical protein
MVLENYKLFVTKNNVIWWWQYLVVCITIAPGDIPKNESQPERRVDTGPLIL